MFRSIKVTFAISNIMQWLVKFNALILEIDGKKSFEIINSLMKYSTDNSASLPIEYFQQYGSDLLRPFIYILSYHWNGFGGSETIIWQTTQQIKITNFEPYLKLQVQGLHPDFLDLIVRYYLALGVFEEIAIKEAQSRDIYSRWFSYKIIQSYLIHLYKEKA